MRTDCAGTRLKIYYFLGPIVKKIILQLYKPVLYRRYVDDTFLLFDSECNIDLFLNFLNSQHPNISFTCDKEIDTVLPFLDLKIKRDSDKFRTYIPGVPEL